ncbi:MAG: hypothetical protein ABIT36_04745 [Steroidobacteraceae bacterium]
MGLERIQIAVAGRKASYPRGVDQTIDATPGVECSGGKPAANGIRSDFGFDAEGLCARVLARSQRVVRLVLTARVIDDDATLRLGKLERAGCADARCRTSDNSHCAFQFHAHKQRRRLAGAMSLHYSACRDSRDRTA